MNPAGIGSQIGAGSTKTYGRESEREMTEKTSYEPGTPCWVDLTTPDLEESIEFYGGLFGWDVPEQENSQQFGGYRRALLGGKSVAGMMQQEGPPPVWSTSVSVADAEATAAKVKEAGGSTIVEPMDVGDLGRMAVFMDPEGAGFGIWQPGSFAGAEQVNDPNTFSWNELNSRQPDAAKEFYGSVFGWGSAEVEMGDAPAYTTWLPGGSDDDDDSIGGLLDMRGRVPDDIPPHWLVYFTVDSRDATLEKAKSDGGTEVLTMDIPFGHLAIISDPHGANFGIFEAIPQDS
jgi:predicted enzyme related to lactoylglutathione lyase